LVELGPAPQLLPVERAAGQVAPWPRGGWAAIERQDGGAIVVAAVLLSQPVAQHFAHPPRRVAEELPHVSHLLAAGVDPPAVLIPAELAVELLNYVVGVREGSQAGGTAVQEAPGVAHQAVASEFQ